MPKNNVFAAIDVGTSKISCLIGEVNEVGNMVILGKGQAPSHGIKKGAVDDIEECSKSIEIAVIEAENSAGLRINSLVAGVSGEFISSVSSWGKIKVTGKNGEITSVDISCAIDAACKNKAEDGKCILHVIPRNFLVDGYYAVRNAMGMIGRDLEVDTYMIAGAELYLKNIGQAIVRSGYEMDSSVYVFSSLAAAKAVMDESEKNLGVTFIDIGAGTTKVTVYKGGSPIHSRIIPVGGDLITRDITDFYKIPLSEAESLKTKEGCACPDLLESDEEERKIEAASFSESQSIVIVQRKVLAKVIEARLMDIFESIKKDIQWLNSRGVYIAGVILTGGVAQTRHINYLAQRVLELPTKVGRPSSIPGLGDWEGNPEFSSVVGIMLMEAEKRISGGAKHHNPFFKVFRKAVQWLQEVFL